MRERWALPAAVAVLVIGTLVHALYGYAHEDLSGHAAGSDDAYISYRYARSLAEGEGLTFNPGERVEGYSNLLYVLLLAPAFAVLRDPGILPLAVAINVLCAIAAILLFHRRVRVRDGAMPAACGAVLLGAWPALWLWNASGMETALVLLLQVALWAEVTRENGASRPLVAIVVLLILARADGFVSAGIAVLFLLLRRDFARARAGVIAIAITMAVLVAFRLGYYGHPLPNTYYAKVSGPLGERIADALRQLADLSVQAGLLPFLVVLGAGAVMALRRRRWMFEPLFAACWLSFWTYVGGDVFGERFLLVLIPLGGSVIARWAGEGHRRLAAAALLCALAFQLAPLVGDRRFRYAGARYDRWIVLGRFLAGPEHRGRVLAVDAAGKVPYYSRLQAIDMLGLTDEHIGHRPAAGFRVGHNKHDADYILERRPDLMATWIDESLDLRWDLGRARYEAAGYRLRWLVYARRFPPSDSRAIVDVTGMDADERRRLVRDGWQYAVVERADQRATARADARTGARAAR